MLYCIVGMLLGSVEGMLLGNVDNDDSNAVQRKSIESTAGDGTLYATTRDTVCKVPAKDDAAAADDNNDADSPGKTDSKTFHNEWNSNDNSTP